MMEKLDFSIIDEFISQNIVYEAIARVLMIKSLL